MGRVAQLDEYARDFYTGWSDKWQDIIDKSSELISNAKYYVKVMEKCREVGSLQYINTEITRIKNIADSDLVQDDKLYYRINILGAFTSLNVADAVIEAAEKVKNTPEDGASIAKEVESDIHDTMEDKLWEEDGEWGSAMEMSEFKETLSLKMEL